MDLGASGEAGQWQGMARRLASAPADGSRQPIARSPDRNHHGRNSASPRGRQLEDERAAQLVGRTDQDHEGAGEVAARADLMVCPPATLLATFATLAQGTPVAIGAQDCHAEPSGAFTGDLSAEMLRDAGAVAVIVGHSERRHLSPGNRRRGERQGARRLARRAHGDRLHRRNQGRARRRQDARRRARADADARCPMARPPRTWWWPTSRCGRSAPG